MRQLPFPPAARHAAHRGTLALAMLLVSSCGGESTPAGLTTPPDPPVASVTLTPAQRTLDVGETLLLTTVLRDQAGLVLTGRTLLWTSSAPASASVDASGLVTGLATGAAVVTASIQGKSATAAIIVTNPVASLFIDSIQPRLFVGRTAQLVFQVRDAGNRPIIFGRDPTWTSSAPSVISISSSGQLNGLAAGSATITGNVEGKTAARVVIAQPIPSAVIAVMPEAALLARGLDYAIVPVVTDIDGQPLTGKSVTWSSSDPAIATVSSGGVVHPIANGVVVITATVEGGLQATSRVTIVDPRTVSGLVAAADGAKPSNLVFVARVGTGVNAQRFITSVDSATGSFRLTMPAIPATGPVADYYVDAVSAASRRYHPSFRTLTAGASPDGARVLLIPHTVVPDSGTYAGRSLTVDLAEAFTAVCTNTTDANCQSYWPSYWIAGIKAWADVSRPMPLAIDRSTSTVQAADSVALWTTIRAMEADLGRQLYKPAAFTSHTSAGYTSGMVLVSRDSTVAPFAGYTNWSWDGTGTIFQAKVRLANSANFANNSLVTHELTHALGFSHTCRWLTVMGGYGCSQQARLGMGDVAYYHLAEMVRRQVNAFRPTWSVSEGLQGARVIEQGLPVASAMPSGLIPMLARLQIPGTDGAP